MKHSLLAPSLLVLTSILLVSCSGGQPPASPKETAAIPITVSTQSGISATASPNNVEIAIKGFAFEPATVTVKVGASITWTNLDNVDHTITSDKGDWDSGKTAQGGKFSHMFDQAGTFTYHCSVHPSMKGTVVVTP